MRLTLWIGAALLGFAAWLMRQAELDGLWRLATAVATLALLALAVWTARDLKQRPHEPPE